jgi:polyphosphate glucokinase
MILGIDIGGSGIKGAVVDTATGELTTDRHRIETPQPSTPGAVADEVAAVLAHHGYSGPVGCTFPGPIQAGVVRMAANMDDSWVGAGADDLFAARVGMPVHLINDADAAGVAEVRFGAGKGVGGVVLVCTFGTGIGTALFTDGQLVPNTELGHLELDGVDAETRAAARWRQEEGLSWKEWAARVEHYLRHLENLFWPTLVILGGGVSRRAEKFLHLVDIRTPLVASRMQNNAGIVGAALEAERRAATGG